MRALIIVVCLFSLGFTAYSQNFPGGDIDLLEGKQLLVKEKDPRLHEFGFENFYSDPSKLKIYSPIDDNRYNTKYESLVAKTFTVASTHKSEVSYNPDYTLILENPEIGTLYYTYDPKFEFNFPFEIVGGLEYPEGYLCKDIETRVDKFDGRTTFYSPMVDGISFTKVKGDTDRTYLSMTTQSSTVNVNVKGVIILLQNGDKINLPDEEIDTKVHSGRGGGFDYTAFIALTDEQIEQLKAQAITDFRLYIYDKTVKEQNKVMDYLKCIAEK
jgi:hypothetical protein